MVIDDSILKKNKVNFTCNFCNYVFKLNYSELKSEETLVFCPLCYTEKMISSKEEIISYLTKLLKI